MNLVKRNKLTVLIVIAGIACIGLFFGLAVFGIGVAGAITTPMQTWGFAYLDSVPVPAGTQVDVYIGGDTTPSGTTITTVLNTYGTIMVMGDSNRYGEPLRYTIDGYPTEKIGPDEGVFGLENQEVSLHGYTNYINVVPEPTHTWAFYSWDFVPKHLPDWFTGTVDLSQIDDMPQEIQGVYKFDDVTSTWLYWVQDAPGCTLDILEGGLFADYMISHCGSSKWEIPLE